MRFAAIQVHHCHKGILQLHKYIHTQEEEESEVVELTANATQGEMRAGGKHSPLHPLSSQGRKFMPRLEKPVTPPRIGARINRGNRVFSSRQPSGGPDGCPQACGAQACGGMLIPPS